MRLLAVVPAVLLLILCCAQPALAEYTGPYNFAVAFGNKGPEAGVFNEYSPVRVSGTTDVEEFPGVNSKFNQPRHVSSTATNPHQGIDVNKKSGPVYPAFTSWIWAKGDKYITLQVDADKDGLKDDNLYVTYDHLVNVTSLAEGTKVLYTDRVADIDPNLKDSYGNNISHLHFGNRSNIEGDGEYEWVRNEVYFRDNSTAQWNKGQDLDLESVVQWIDGHTARLIIYVRDDTVKKYITQGHVRAYHRLTGPGAWSWDTMTRAADQVTFEYDLRNRYSLGTAVDWMVRVERSDQKQTYPNDYYYAFHPEKYTRPNQDPNAVPNPYPFYTHTIY